VKKAMTPLVAAFLVVVLCAPAMASPQNRRPRTSTANYTGFGAITESAYPAVFSQERFSEEGVGTAFGIATRREKRVGVKLYDVAGQNAAAWVYFVRPGGGESYSTRLICPETTRPLPIDPEFAIVVITAVGQCGGQPSVPSRGQVVFTYYKR
jgi:hypothetical protein